MNQETLRVRMFAGPNGSIEEWEAIEKILQKIEDEEDVQEALLALKEVEEQGSIPFDEMKKRVGL